MIEKIPDEIWRSRDSEKINELCEEINQINIKLNDIYKLIEPAP